MHVRRFGEHEGCLPSQRSRRGHLRRTSWSGQVRATRRRRFPQGAPGVGGRGDWAFAGSTPPPSTSKTCGNVERFPQTLKTVLIRQPRPRVSGAPAVAARHVPQLLRPAAGTPRAGKLTPLIAFNSRLTASRCSRCTHPLRRPRGQGRWLRPVHAALPQSTAAYIRRPAPTSTGASARSSPHACPRRPRGRSAAPQADVRSEPRLPVTFRSDTSPQCPATDVVDVSQPGA